MHSFSVNIQDLSTQKSDVLGALGHHFGGLTNPDVNRKRMKKNESIVLLYDFLVRVF